MLFFIILIILGIALYKKSKNTFSYNTFNPRLDRRVQFLLKQFASKKLTIKKEFPFPKDLNKITPENLEKVLDKILDHMKLKKNVFLMYHSREEEAFKDKGGTYEQGCLGNRAINLVLDPKYTLEDYISILAHECAHHFMDVYSFEIQKTLENEKNTDTLAILLGFGRYLAKTHRNRTYYKGSSFTFNGTLNHYETSKLGYLSIDEVNYITYKHRDILKKGKKQKEEIEVKIKVMEKESKLFKGLNERLIELQKECRKNKISINRIISMQGKGHIDSKWDLEKISLIIHKYENNTYNQCIERLKQKVNVGKDRSEIIREVDKLNEELRKDSFFIEKYLK